MKIIILFLISAAIFIYSCAKSRRPVRNSCIGFITGGVSLFIVSAINTYIPINFLTLSVSMLSGPAFAVFLLAVYS